MEIWRRDEDVATWKYGGMEVWRLAAGVATWRHGGMELWRRVPGVATWRCMEVIELWRRAASVQMRSEIWSAGGRCRCRGMRRGALEIAGSALTIVDTRLKLAGRLSWLRK